MTLEKTMERLFMCLQDLHVPASEVDAKDADTPDNWVPRDPRIVRLTGRHPLNCEPPMQDLMASGFITPPSIHYVRNHGAVPKLEWGTHRCAATYCAAILA